MLQDKISFKYIYLTVPMQWTLSTVISREIAPFDWNKHDNVGMLGFSLSIYGKMIVIMADSETKWQVGC